MHAHYRHLFGAPCNQLLLNNPLLDDHPVMKSITVSTVLRMETRPEHNNKTATERAGMKYFSL